VWHDGGNLSLFSVIDSAAAVSAGYRYINTYMYILYCTFIYICIVHVYRLFFPRYIIITIIITAIRWLDSKIFSFVLQVLVVRSLGAGSGEKIYPSPSLPFLTVPLTKLA